MRLLTWWRKVWFAVAPVLLPFLRSTAIAVATDPEVQAVARAAVIAGIKGIQSGSIDKDGTFSAAAKTTMRTAGISAMGYAAVAVQVAFDKLKAEGKIPYSPPAVPQP